MTSPVAPHRPPPPPPPLPLPPPPPQPSPSSGHCSGDSCPHPNTWPLHHVRLRGTFLRLCTSCVLRHHPGSFCPTCFNLLDPPSSSTPTPLLVHCSRCPSVSHASCLPSSSPTFLCPFCSNPSSSFSLFPHRPSPLDSRSSKILLAAARVAHSSMRKAAAASRAEADRKVRDSVVARRRAREALERAALLAREKDGTPVDVKRKAERRPQGREKLVKPNDPVPETATATAIVTPRNGTNQVRSIGGIGSVEPRLKSVYPSPAAMLPGQY